MHRRPCACGQKTAEIFFGNLILDEAAIAELYCPECSAAAPEDKATTVNDNGWVIELDADVLRVFAPRMKLDPETLTAEEVFDKGFVTWVGFSPEDNRLRAVEREEIAQRTAGDKKAQFLAFKQWAIERETRFVKEGWRKAIHNAA
jgi:hypothetical protein